MAVWRPNSGVQNLEMHMATVRIYLQNVRSLNTACGFAEAETREAAIAEALRLAQQRDPNAKFNGSVVEFAESVTL